MVEITIITASMMLLRNEFTTKQLGLLSGLVGYFLILWAIRGLPDPKGARDLLSPMIFFCLGLRFGSVEGSKVLLMHVSAAVLIVAAFEFADPEGFVSLFPVFDYYMSKGMISVSDIDKVTNGLYISGMRPEGRSMFPILGDHRLSSLFLEPVSMGNFGVVVAIWALSREWHQRSQIVVGMIISMSVIIATDSRFAALTVSFILILRASPVWKIDNVVLVMPCLVAALLASLAAMDSTGVYADNLYGRLLYSGSVLLAMNPLGIFGLEVWNTSSTEDAGYAYALQAFGLPGCIVMWLVFSLMPSPTYSAQRMKLFTAVYICFILGISGTSLFSIKTAALLWFLIGYEFQSPRVPSDGRSH